MQTTVTMELQRLVASLQRYVALTLKEPADALAKKGRDLDYELQKEFSKVRNPQDVVGHRTRILNRAQSLKGHLRNISRRAFELADTLMGGQKSVVGKVVAEGDRILIRTVRVGKRGKRITGGRNGRGGRAATLAEYKAETFSKASGEGILNRRAIIVAIGTMLRMRGSGSLAASWLFKRWRRGLRGTWRLENVNPKATVTLQGTAQMTGDADGAELTITSKMPGVDKFPAAVAQALATVTADTRKYLRDRYNDHAREAGLA
jgi:hypothetical protein